MFRPVMRLIGQIKSKLHVSLFPVDYVIHCRLNGPFLCPGSLHMHKCTRICCLLVYERNLGSTNVPVTTNPAPSASLFSASFLSWKPKVSKQSSLISPVHPFIKHKETDCRIDCAAWEPSGTTNRIEKNWKIPKQRNERVIEAMQQVYLIYLWSAVAVNPSSQLSLCLKNETHELP